MMKWSIAIVLGVIVSSLGFSSGLKAADDKVKIVKQPLQKDETDHVNVYNANGEILRVLIKYNNGGVRTEEYENNARKLVVESDTTGWSRRSEYDSTLTKVTETLSSGRKIILINIDTLGKSKKGKVELSSQDELHLIYTSEPWPGRRTDSVSSKNSGTLSPGGSTTPHVPEGKLISSGSFSAKKTGSEELKVKTELISAGFPGPHGRPPKATTVEVTIDVIVK